MPRKIFDKIRKILLYIFLKKGLLGKSIFPDHTERLRRSSKLETQNKFIPEKSLEVFYF